MKNKKSAASIGEFGIINIIKNFSRRKRDKNIIADIGDDAFCFKSQKEITAITKDMLIEDIHFKKEWIKPFDLGAKSVEVNVSDIAAMGDLTPKYIFIGLGLSADTSLDFIKQFARGIKKTCQKYSIRISGGDTVRADKITISITLLAAANKKIVRRNGAKAGDLIGVTNSFGDSAAGLELLYKYKTKRIDDKNKLYLISKHNRPKARLKEAHILSPYINSMTDSSDGLDFSVRLIAKDSKKGASISIDKIPLSRQLKNAVKDEKKLMEYALFGAEDYELVFTIPPSKADIAKKTLPQISYIGTILNENAIHYENNGKKIKINPKGFKHF